MNSISWVANVTAPVSGTVYFRFHDVDDGQRVFVNGVRQFSAAAGYGSANVTAACATDCWNTPSPTNGIYAVTMVAGVPVLMEFQQKNNGGGGIRAQLDWDLYNTSNVARIHPGPAERLLAHEQRGERVVLQRWRRPNHPHQPDLLDGLPVDLLERQQQLLALHPVERQ